MNNPNLTCYCSFWRPLGSALVIGSLILLLSNPVPAVDPLPTELEQASEQVQAAYREQSARESLRETIAVGQQRHIARTAFKQTLVSHLQQEAAEKVASIQLQIHRPPPTRQSAGWKTPTLIGLGTLGLLLVGGFVYRRRKVV